MIHIILKLNLKVFSNIIISRQQKKYRNNVFLNFNFKQILYSISNYHNLISPLSENKSFDIFLSELNISLLMKMIIITVYLIISFNSELIF